MKMKKVSWDILLSHGILNSVSLEIYDSAKEYFERDRLMVLIGIIKEGCR